MQPRCTFNPPPSRWIAFAFLFGVMVAIVQANAR
jgi:hypothetical protein